MEILINKAIINLFFLFGLINFANFSPLKNVNIEITNSTVTILYGGEKYFNESNSDHNLLIDTRFEEDKNENKRGYDTTGEHKYVRYFVASSPVNCFSYKVMSKNQTHIGLFSSNVPKTNPWIEIVVGGLPDGLGNIFRRNGADIGGTYNQQQNSLNEYEYRGYWISWSGGHYQVGIKGQKPFMSWHDPNPFKINYIGVDTCCGTVGHVIPEEPMCPGINM